MDGGECWLLQKADVENIWKTAPSVLRWVICVDKLSTVFWLSLTKKNVRIVVAFASSFGIKRKLKLSISLAERISKGIE